MSEPYDPRIPEPNGIGNGMPEAPWSTPTPGQMGAGGLPGGVPGWGQPQPQPQDQPPPGTWPTPPNTWSYTPYPVPPQRSAGKSWAVRSGIGIGVAAAIVAAFVAVHVVASGSSSASSSNNNTAANSTPGAISSSSPSLTDLNVCLSAGQPLLTMLNVLGTSNTDPTTMAAAIQMAINQEQQIANTLPAGTSKTEITKTISELQTMHTDVAAGNYAAEGTDLQALSTDTDGIMGACG